MQFPCLCSFVGASVDVRPPPAASRLVPLSGGTVFSWCSRLCKTPPPGRGGGPQGRRGFPCTRVTYSFSIMQFPCLCSFVGASVDVRPPPAASRLVPLSGGTVFFMRQFLGIFSLFFFFHDKSFYLFKDGVHVVIYIFVLET